MPGPKKSAPRGKPWFVTMKDATLHGRLKFVRRKWLVVRLLDTCLCSTKPYGQGRKKKGRPGDEVRFGIGSKWKDYLDRVKKTSQGRTIDVLITVGEKLRVGSRGGMWDVELSLRFGNAT